MAPTPSPRPTPVGNQAHQTPFKTPISRHRLHFPTPKTGGGGTGGPHFTATVPTEHPVEVIGRIRDHSDRKDKIQTSALEISGDGRSVRVRTEIGCRDFALDGVSVSEQEDLESFYNRFVRSRIEGVRVGSKCTVMMYGPTGSGKSHTMFGCAKQPGIVYRALRDILGDGAHNQREEEAGEDVGFGIGLFVQVTVLEIYNEEIYDLLSSSHGASSNKGNTQKVRLEIMGKKAKNANCLTGNDAGKIAREVAKVEKRRIVKSTLCNERSSRSHCMIILDVPSVGGRLMLVDMAGSENIEAAGQTGFEAKMQTAKINQGNIALKRVVESIANGDSHVPFRDSKLTMLLQDSFEDDRSKILMILCASPDQRELHKTISTLEYGAKAKCIIRAAHISTPKEKCTNPDESSVLLNSRIVAMNQFIYKLQMDNKAKEKERDAARKELTRLKSQVEQEVNSKVLERTQVLNLELKRMEDRVHEQQEELELLQNRLQELERERESSVTVGPTGKLATRLSEMGDQCMVASMELDLGDAPNNTVIDVKEIKEDMHRSTGFVWSESEPGPGSDKAVLSTVYEEEGEGEEEREEEEKQVVEEKLERSGVVKIGSEIERNMRIENIHTLCGIHRELAKLGKVQDAMTPVKQQIYGDENLQPAGVTPVSVSKKLGFESSPVSVKGEAKENCVVSAAAPFSPIENTVTGAGAATTTTTCF